MIKRKLKLNVDLGERGKKDSVIEIDCDKWGIPLAHFWRQRVLDSEFDGCVEFIEENGTKKETKTTKDKKKSVEKIEPKGDKS